MPKVNDVDLAWCLRDFKLEFKTLTPNSYLSQCLEGGSGNGPEAAVRNKVKSYLQTSFSKTQCFALPRPTEGDPTLLDAGAEMNPEFETAVAAMVTQLKQSHKKKKVGHL